jgi:hypothetical protein
MCVKSIYVWLVGLKKCHEYYVVFAISLSEWVVKLPGNITFFEIFDLRDFTPDIQPSIWPSFSTFYSRPLQLTLDIRPIGNIDKHELCELSDTMISISNNIIWLHGYPK